MRPYHEIYSKEETLPQHSLSLKSSNEFQRILTSYVMSSHNLECERGKWIRKPKGERYCRQCLTEDEEDLTHFLFECTYFQHIRNRYSCLPQNKSISNFFKWEHSEILLAKLHSHIKQQ